MLVSGLLLDLNGKEETKPLEAGEGSIASPQEEVIRPTNPLQFGAVCCPDAQEISALHAEMAASHASQLSSFWWPRSLYVIMGTCLLFCPGKEKWKIQVIFLLSLIQLMKMILHQKQLSPLPRQILLVNEYEQCSS